MGTSLAVQWLRLHASTSGGAGSIPGWGTKISYAAWHSQINKQTVVSTSFLCPGTKSPFIFHFSTGWLAQRLSHYSLCYGLEITASSQKPYKLGHQQQIWPSSVTSPSAPFPLPFQCPPGLYRKCPASFMIDTCFWISLLPSRVSQVAESLPRGCTR